MKIAMCGLIKSENLGEMFIARSLEYLISDEAARRKPGTKIEYVRVDLLGRNDEIFEIDDARERRIRNYYHYNPKAKIAEKIFLSLQALGR